MKKHLWTALLIIPISLSIISCATTSVKRVSSDTAIDLSGRWNDIDAQQVAQAMIDDVIKRPWLGNFTDANTRKPVVIIGDIRNRSSEHIDASVFTKDIEEELVNSGKVTFVASDKEREAIRAERTDQQTEADPATIKRLGKETGADFILQGLITTQVDAVDGRKVVSYKVDLELIDIQSNEKVWLKNKVIKKDITQASTAF